MNMTDIKIRHNGIKPDNVVAEFNLYYTEGDKGGREASLYGCGTNEIVARQNLIKQAKAMRDKLNNAIEGMIDQLLPTAPRT